MNNARVLLESRLRVTERASGRVHAFVLGASCKTERVGADADIWIIPNADFMPLFSDTHFMHLKTYARAGTARESWPPGSGEQSDRLQVDIAGTFDRVHLDLVEHEAEPLPTAQDIVEATLANLPLVAVLHIEEDRYIADLEFPVKTMNANERAWIYQTDTGPVLFPDLGQAPGDLLGAMQTAFVAVNAPDWAEFIVRERAPIADGVEVYHYAKPVRFDGIRAELFTIPPGSAGASRRVELPVAEGGQGA
jgi:hypothetical protein